MCGWKSGRKCMGTQMAAMMGSMREIQLVTMTDEQRELEMGSMREIQWVSMTDEQ